VDAEKALVESITKTRTHAKEAAKPKAAVRRKAAAPKAKARAMAAEV